MRLWNPCRLALLAALLAGCHGGAPGQGASGTSGASGSSGAVAAPCARVHSPMMSGDDAGTAVCLAGTARDLCDAGSFFCPFDDGGGACLDTESAAQAQCGGACEACDSSDAQTGPDGGTCYGAAPPPTPASVDAGTGWPILPWQGGPVQHAPELVVMTFDELAADAGAGQPTLRDGIEAYYGWLADAGWLASVAGEYGVTGSQVVAVDHLGPAPAALDDAQIQARIESEIAAGRAPAPDAETEYFVHTSPGTTVSWDGFTLCADMLGYHGWDPHAAYPGDGGCAFPIAYSVIATCPPPPGTGQTVLSQVELAASHHLAEVATDPLGTAIWLSDPDSPWAWVDGEVADLCDPIAFYYPATYQTDGGTWVTSRVWSNAAAAAGAVDPCVPTVGTTAKQVAQTVPEQVLVGAAGQSLSFTTVGLGGSGAPAGWVAHVFQVGGTFSALPASGVRFNSGPGVSNTVQLSIPATATSGEMAELEIHVLEQSFLVDQMVGVVFVRVQ